MCFIKIPVNVLENGVAKQNNTLKPIDTPLYGYWRALFLSFYSKRLYIDVAKRWKGFGLIYLFLSIAILAIPLSIQVLVDFNKSFDEQIVGTLKLLPEVYVQNGSISFDKPMPYLVKNNKNQVVIIIDTTGKITSFSQEYPDLTILVTKNTMYIKLPSLQMLNKPGAQKNSSVPLAQSFGQHDNMIIDGKKIITDPAISKLKLLSQLIIYPIIVAMLYSIFLVIFLVLAFLGQVFASIFFTFKLNYRTSCRLFMVAATPFLLVLLIISLSLNVIFPGSGIVLLFLIGAYYSFAIHSVRSESKQVVLE